MQEYIAFGNHTIIMIEGDGGRKKRNRHRVDSIRDTRDPVADIINWKLQVMVA